MKKFLSSTKTLLLLLLLFACTAVSAQYYNGSFALPAQSSWVHQPSRNKTVVDALGNIYLTASYQWTDFDMDPGPGIVYGHNNAGRGFFIAKYSPDGGLLWVKTLPGAAGWVSESIDNLKVDAQGNLILCGGYYGSLDFDPGPGQFTLASHPSSETGFVASYDGAGNLRYAWLFEGPGVATVNALQPLPSGELLLAGTIQYDSVDLDPGAGTRFHPVDNVSDGFIGRYNTAGDLLDLKVIDAGISLAAVEVKAAGMEVGGEIWAYGSWRLDADFDQQPGFQTVSSSGSDDGFLVRYASAGALQWIRAFGGNFRPITDGAVHTPTGEYLVAGWMTTPTDMDPGPGTSITSDTSVLAKYDANGNYLGKVDLGGVIDWLGNADTLQQVWIAGQLTGNNGFDVDPGLGVNMLSINSGATAWAATYDVSLAYQSGWCLHGAPSHDPDVALHHAQVNANGKLYVSGFYRSRTDLDPGLSIVSYPINPTHVPYYIFVANYGGPAVSISGNVYLDFNANGVMDSTDIPCRWCPVSSGQSNGATTLTDAEGNYAIRLDTGTHTLTCSLQHYTSVPGQVVATLPTYGMQQTGADFALQPVASVVEIEAEVIGPPIGRPGRAFGRTFVARNHGTVAVNTPLEVHFDSLLSLSWSDIAPDSSAPGYLRWDSGTLNPLHDYTVRMGFIVSTQATPADNPLGIDLALNPNPTDTTASDNYDTLDVDLIAPLDPNAIHLTPSCFASLAELQEPIEFLVQFQNVGNDTSFDVRILDTLDAELDLSTLRFVGASHTVTGFTLDPHRVLEIRFDNIQLPDSHDNLIGSNGYIQFECKARPSMVWGDEIRSQAHIFFDFNAPVATNVDGVRAEEFTVTTTGSTSGNGTITVVPASGASYQYSLDGGAAQSSGTFTGVSAGNYVVEVSDGAGCNHSISATVSGVVGIDAILDPNGVRVFPNPSRGVFSISTETGVVSEVRVMDLQGREVMATTPKASRCTVNLTDQPQGVYLMAVRVGTSTVWKKVILE